MQPLSLLNGVLLLQLAIFTFAQSVGGDIPASGILGGQAAVQHLPRQTIEEEIFYSTSHVQRRDLDKRCGPGFGFCTPGNWYVQSKKPVHLR
jgi:hypothetical protein